MGNASSAAPSVKPVAAETSSSCVTQAITAAHNFEVSNFSLLEGMGVGEFVSSSIFRVGDFDWSIWLYPDGNSPDNKNKVSAFLTPRGGGQEGVRRVTRFTFAVLGRDGKVWKKRNGKHTFKPPFHGWGWSNLMEKSSRFRTRLRDSNDGFTVRCVLTVIQDRRVAIAVPEPSVLRDLATMLRDGDGADVAFDVGGRSFPAHRCVLAARSAVFRAELFGSMKEKTATRVTVDDMEPSVFEALLHFVYTDSLPDDDGDGGAGAAADDGDRGRNYVAMMQHLLVPADRYGVDRLKAICEHKLCHAIDVETVATTLALAEHYHCVQLKDGCLRFIASGDVLGAVKKTDGFKHLVASCPLLMKEILFY